MLQQLHERVSALLNRLNEPTIPPENIGHIMGNLEQISSSLDGITVDCSEEQCQLIAALLTEVEALF